MVNTIKTAGHSLMGPKVATYDLMKPDQAGILNGTNTQTQKHTTAMNIPKSDWGSGPWLSEKDELFWEDKGYGCLILRSPVTGCLNGYIAIGPEHPWYNLEKEDIDANVHGGFTYKGANYKVADIGHPSYDHLGYIVIWLGFDTGHTFDYMPAIAAYLTTVKAEFNEWQERRNYKTWDYVKEELYELVRQAEEAGWERGYSGGTRGSKTGRRHEVGAREETPKK